MKMSKHSIIDHKHSTFLVLISPATHIYIRKVYECMCGLWYWHACDMADDLNQIRTLSTYQAHQTGFCYISPPSSRKPNQWDWLNWYILQYEHFFKKPRSIPSCLIGIMRNMQNRRCHVHIFWLQKGMPCLTYCLNSKHLFILYFTVLSSPYSVSLDRWQADTDDRQIYIRTVTQEQLHTDQGRLPILRGIWVFLL